MTAPSCRGRLSNAPAEIAILQAEFLSQAAGNVGAIAFSRTGDPDVGKFEDAVVLKTFGDLSVDLMMLN
jgi:hypothetical protein